eukprot:m.108361 g.108361  ORF g.108361 m.108361 type:complete len:548 (+) comp27868_c0_seq2:354-1997(+)
MTHSFNQGVGVGFVLGMTLSLVGTMVFQGTSSDNLRRTVYTFNRFGERQANLRQPVVGDQKIVTAALSECLRALKQQQQTGPSKFGQTDAPYLSNTQKRWRCCVTQQEWDKNCPPCLNISKHLRTQSDHDPNQWVGDIREKERAQMFGKCYSSTPTPRNGDTCWNRKSNTAALEDTRGLVIAGGSKNGAKVFAKGVGLGNQLFAAAGLIAKGLRLGRVAAVGCGSCYLNSIFRNLHCVEKLDFTASELNKTVLFSDGGYLQSADDLAVLRNTTPSKVLDFSLFFQHAKSFQDYTPGVCAALQPSSSLQQRTQAFFNSLLSNVLLTSHSRTIALHVRRGDYAEHNHPQRYGLLSTRYYIEALNLIRNRVALDEPDSVDELVAIVFTTQESVAWCTTDLAPLLQRVVKTVVCANTSTHNNGEATDARCQGEEIDLLAMSLADYLVMANSTFSWWAHFFQTCRLRILDWWTVPVSSNTSSDGEGLTSEIQAVVMPTVWMNEEVERVFNPRTAGAFQSDKLGGGRSMVNSFYLNSEYLITPINLKSLFQQT